MSIEYFQRRAQSALSARNASVCGQQQNPTVNSQLDAPFEFEKNILRDPIGEYKKLSFRICNNINPSFPEFKPVIDYLLKELVENEDIQKTIHENKTLKSLYDIVTIKAKFLNIKVNNKDNISYFANYTKSYPYRDSIMVICSILEFIQIYLEQSSINIAPLYHFDRYQYLLNLLLENKELILIPTNYNLQLEDFIVTRHVPIYFIGVSSKEIFYDGRLQSPLEYFYHDINHSRRLFFTMSYSVEEMILTNYFIKTHIKNALTKNKYVKYVLFELFHEYSIPINGVYIKKEMSRIAGDNSPYEMITDINGFSNNMELLENGNVNSGMLNRNVLGIHEITYYHQQYATVYSTTYHKLKYGFHNNSNKEFTNMNIEDLLDAFEIVAELFYFNINRNSVMDLMLNKKRVEIYTTQYEDREKFIK